MDVWGYMPRDNQETLFETAMNGHDAEREEFARLLHDRHPGLCIRRSRTEEPDFATRVYPSWQPSRG
ncbi:hypothetical protein ACVWVY_002679 [Bradyrhizobium sp. URHC0002]|jgi:hypothetical protein